MVTKINHLLIALLGPVLVFFLKYFTQAAVICRQNKRGNDIHRGWLDKTPIIIG